MEQYRELQVAATLLQCTFQTVAGSYNLATMLQLIANLLQCIDAKR